MVAPEAGRHEVTEQADRLRTERRYRSIFNSASVGLCETDLSALMSFLDQLATQHADVPKLLRAQPDLVAQAAGLWKIHEVNEAGLRLLGARRTQELPESFGELVRSASKTTFRDLLIALSGQVSSYEFELHIRTLEAERDALFTLALPVDRAEFGNVVVSILDITDRKRLERELWSMQRMEAIGSLTGGVAHDFNNLLMVIGSYAGFLLDYFREGDPGREDVLVIRDAMQRAAALTNQLLAFGRRQVQHLEILNLNNTISELETVLRSAIGEHIECAFRLGKELALVKADRSQVEQVVMNLVVNARDAMPEGGTLVIETANVVANSPAVKPDSVPPGNYVMLAVTDTGAGMDDDTRMRIFEPFFSTKERVGASTLGAGLGLSTVYGIISQSKGYIYVHSELGRGTSFEAYFPCVDEARNSLLPSPSLGPGPHGGETVLLVEDEAAVRIATRRILENHGYRVLEATQGPEALFLAQAHEGPIALLLTDIVMPNMRGDELARRLKQSRPDVQVLFVSGYTESALTQRGSLPGAPHFVQKPFSPHALLRKVRQVLDAGAASTERAK